MGEAPVAVTEVIAALAGVAEKRDVIMARTRVRRKAFLRLRRN
jgi:hypothetical protein